MQYSIVSRVAYNADAVRTKGVLKRPSANAQHRSADPPPDASQDAERDASDGEEAYSTVGLSILAQALAAYSQY
jgi:hypothetical protein